MAVYNGVNNTYVNFIWSFGVLGNEILGYESSSDIKSLISFKPFAQQVVIIIQKSSILLQTIFNLVHLTF
nr:MAG TPA: hypothetical protein [Caudoviricetes sp.]